ncbi:2133_t:CDS:2 [Gigaspora rosea]|nr:2133_t:CDS:2 [Gigaspora rosea]
MSQRSIAQQRRQEHKRNERQQEPNQCAAAQQQQRHKNMTTQEVITQQLQQACEQEAHESEPSLETIAQHNRSEHETNNPNPTENATSTPSKRSIAQ